MNDFEHELKASLKRVEPPADLAEEVLARVAAERRRPGRGHAARWLPWAMAAALAVAAGPAVRQWRGERAKAELLMAIDITNHQLERVEQRLDSLNQRTIP